ncbi:MAG: bifunctional methylenetetrahydrofolate dehydrogenase/methenyltetrahydrofolate cyclohydrolase FolD [Acidobacteria bacterium]|nr:MAG: bifunctional methylenetetrahydrofolate dehydrogenase/methenyltetrahydrofolate cyclohydrolase FolD [Acidobacteriota bacterium]
MAARLLDGKELARKIRREVSARAAAFAARAGRPPGLAVVLVGDDPASAVYVRNKERAARRAGFRSEVVRLPADVGREDLLSRVRALGESPEIDGLLVQLPLPEHLDPAEVQRAVPPAKDVDGFHPENAGRLLLGQPGGLVPCTPRGALALIELAGARLEGSRAVVVGRSNIVGKPLALLLLARHATVTLCHSRTPDLASECRRADVLVSAVGRPGLITAEHVKPGAVVIDVGINRITDPGLASRLLAGQPDRLARFEETGSALVGDVDFPSVREVAGALTPVPGGVGPLTVAMLLDNTLLAAEAAARR